MSRLSSDDSFHFELSDLNPRSGQEAASLPRGNFFNPFIGTQESPNGTADLNAAKGSCHSPEDLQGFSEAWCAALHQRAVPHPCLYLLLAYCSLSSAFGGGRPRASWSITGQKARRALRAVLAIVIVLTDGNQHTVKHDAAVENLRLFVQNVRYLKAGWLIPIAIPIAISFPPLVGHEILHGLLCDDQASSRLPAHARHGSE
ncbi:hypothetical protein QBC43DRAFT_291804 [Cladorrhinum sp. PSN259]|nr:hypothetical protein QBC43DRAFT_291804 [Cladorrhinum sp. PSN259]